MMIPLPIAPLKEQRRIVEKIDALFLLCDEFEHNISEVKDFPHNLWKQSCRKRLAYKKLQHLHMLSNSIRIKQRLKLSCWRCPW